MLDYYFNTLYLIINVLLLKYTSTWFDMITYFSQQCYFIIKFPFHAVLHYYDDETCFELFVFSSKFFLIFNLSNWLLFHFSTDTIKVIK